MDPVKFLRMVWGEQECYVDLPSKASGHWMPYVIEWPDEELARLRIKNSQEVTYPRRDPFTSEKEEWHEDIYFSVARFGARYRLENHVLPCSWLWADLDRVDPEWAAQNGLEPFVAWESSPGRFQALWKMDRELKPRALARVNQRLTYWLNADRGGWDLTQVLRIPGTHNWKYKGGPIVEVVHEGGPTHTVGHILEVTRDSTLPVRQPTRSERRAAKLVGQLSGRARSLLRTPADMVVEGERSSRLFELERLLIEEGLDEDSIVGLVAGTPWNKWGTGPSGESRLRQDVRRAFKRGRTNGAKSVPAAKTTRVAGVTRIEEIKHPVEDLAPDADDEDEDRSGLLNQVVWYDETYTKRFDDPKWLVKEIWAEGNGIIGGDPKSSKTFFGIGLGLAVASGMPFLGEFPTETTGTTLVMIEEGAAWDHYDKLHRLAKLCGLLPEKDPVFRDSGEAVIQFPYDVPMAMLTRTQFDMGLEEAREEMEYAVAEIKPTLVVLDPLYLLLGSADENRASDLRPFLKWMNALKDEHGCSIAVAHHFRKNAGGKPGHRLMGSNAFYGWVDSALYCERLEPEDDWNRIVKVEREFRAHQSYPPLEVKMQMGDYGDLDLEIEAEGFDPDDYVEFPQRGGGEKTHRQMSRVLGLIKRESDGLTTPEVAKELGMPYQSVRNCLRELEDQSKVFRGEQRNAGGRGRPSYIYHAVDGNEPS